MPSELHPATLAAYLDGELSSEEAAIVREHIVRCSQCATELADMAKLQRSVRAAHTHFAPGDEFRRRMQKQVARPVHRRWWSWGWIPAAATVLAVLLVASAWLLYSKRSAAFSEMADLHVNALASANPVDVVSTDRHTVKPWFAGKIPFSFNVPEFNGSDFSLLGGRVVYFHQEPGAQLIVAMHQHKISVLIFQESDELSRAFAGFADTTHRNSFTMETWQSQGLRFVVIGDADPGAIGNLSSLFAQVNQ